MGQPANLTAWKQAYRPTAVASGVGDVRSSGCVRPTDCLASNGCWTDCCSFDARVTSLLGPNSRRTVAVHARMALWSRADHEKAHSQSCTHPPATFCLDACI